MKTGRALLSNAALIALLLLVSYDPLHAQGFQEPTGRSVGKVRAAANLIYMTLDEGAFGKETLFDLTQRTVKFTPDGAAYRVETLPLKWDADFGAELSGAQIVLKKFTFPFSGKNWESLTVGVNGSIAFPTAAAAPDAGPAGRGGRGARVRAGHRAAVAAASLLRTDSRNCRTSRARWQTPSRPSWFSSDCASKPSRITRPAAM